MPMQQDILLSGPRLAIALVLLIILILFAVRSKHLSSFLAASLLATMALLIVAFSDLERIIVAVGCAAGSLLVSLIGTRRRRKAINLRAELDRMSARLARLEDAESRRVLNKIRSHHPKSSQLLEAGETAKAKDGLGRELPVAESSVITKIYS
jgi:TolA-binding protein